MNVLRKISVVIAFLFLCVAFYHFFIRKLGFTWILSTIVIAIFTLLNGIDNLKEEKKMLGFIYIISCLIASIVLMKEFYISIS